jgi:hypothetical protein
MIGGACAQSAGIGTDILVSFPRLILRRSCGPVTGRRAVLKVNARGRSVRIH